MSDLRTFALNRKARYEYEILETVEAGIVLFGSEIKSVRDGKVSIAEAYAKPENGEIWLVNAHIAHYSSADLNNHDPTRPRKLLLHKYQIKNLAKQVSEKGLTIVPLRLYLKRHRARIELALARGRQRYEKRRTILERERRRQADEAVKRHRLN